MKTKEIFVIEYEYTGHDLDSGMRVTDTVGITAKSADDEIKLDILENIFKQQIENHPVMSLNGNTWELDDYCKTGTVFKKTITYEKISESNFKKEYPIVLE